VAKQKDEERRRGEVEESDLDEEDVEALDQIWDAIDDIRAEIAESEGGPRADRRGT
jgi:hypothetical protein